MLAGSTLAGSPIAGFPAFNGGDDVYLETIALASLIPGLSADTIYIKRGDTALRFTDTIKDRDGVAIDLTGCTVSIIFKNLLTDGIEENAAVIAAEDAGEVEYEISAGGAETDDVGEFLVEWEVTTADSKKFTYPRRGYYLVNILNDLDMA